MGAFAHEHRYPRLVRALIRCTQLTDKFMAISLRNRRRLFRTVAGRLIPPKRTPALDTTVRPRGQSDSFVRSRLPERDGLSAGERS